ncbi:halo-CC-star protein HcsS [Natronococcus sp. A-GB7]|uniref:halo-CC-star protein HcsS n=1 Tax=Natronococcus sp. A-GB7 TaxID=3037649 RepID=UPI00241FAC24|nr:halo-CC-star protein HcsS [Natronococcus sp. A-GB7]MDG5820807.1 halo-CC-star protein HcsS [Natronococcus sp. A-GB7]
MLLSSSDEEVLAAAEALGEDLDMAQSEATAAEFESLLIECNETISAEIGLEYGAVCDAGSDCC